MSFMSEAVLRQFRDVGLCEWCGLFRHSGTDPAHIFSRGAGRVDAPFNLNSLCRWCHGLQHAGKIDRLLLLVVAGHREKMLISDIEEEVWRLRRERQS